MLFSLNYSKIQIADRLQTLNLHLLHQHALSRVPCKLVKSIVIVKILALNDLVFSPKLTSIIAKRKINAIVNETNQFK